MASRARGAPAKSPYIIRRRLCVMVRMRSFVVPFVIGLLGRAAALAHRLATKADRAATVAAVVRQRELSKAQAACQVVTSPTAISATRP
jgi:hypothetical protein